MDNTTNNTLPSYLDQSPEVSARFEKLKNRDVILEVKNLVKTYKTNKGETVALNNVSFKTHKREFVCIIGPSGCGKSTLARVLAGLESYSGGEVLLDGKPVTGPGRDRGMVFSRVYIIPLAYSQTERDVWSRDERHGQHRGGQRSRVMVRVGRS